MPDSLVIATPEGGEPHLPNVSYGSRLCENADAEIFRALIESRRWRGRFIIAAKAEFTAQYFVLVSKNLFLHSLGQKQTLTVPLVMSALGGEADINQAKADMASGMSEVG